MRNSIGPITSLHCIGLLLLAACSSGGGGSSPSMQSTGTSQSNPVQTVSINAAIRPFIGVDASNNTLQFPIATSSAPNFNSSYPSNGTVFPLLGTSITVEAPTYVGTNDFEAANTLTFTGTQTVNGAPQGIFELKDPGIGVDATNLSGTGTPVTLADGRQLVFAGASLNYSLYGVWGLTPGTSGQTGFVAYLQAGVSGYQTPTNAVPTTGSATYGANGTSSGVVGGFLLAPSGTGSITLSTLQGQANIGVNFASGSVSGNMTNMMVTPGNGTATAWNNVSISGSLSGSNLLGTTASSGTPPSGTNSFDSSSTGTFVGALFGPNAQELGAAWTLHDATGQGKTAFGYVGATKQ